MPPGGRQTRRSPLGVRLFDIVVQFKALAQVGYGVRAPAIRRIRSGMYGKFCEAAGAGWRGSPKTGCAGAGRIDVFLRRQPGDAAAPPGYRRATPGRSATGRCQPPCGRHPVSGTVAPQTPRRSARWWCIHCLSRSCSKLLRVSSMNSTRSPSRAGQGLFCWYLSARSTPSARDFRLAGLVFFGCCSALRHFA